MQTCSSITQLWRELPCQGPVRRLAGSSSGSSSTRRCSDVTAHVRRSKQYIGRKELQKQAKQEYIRRIYEAADRVEEDHLVFTLQPASPRVRAELQEADQHAALNRQLAQHIPGLASWQALAQFVKQHGASLNFLNVVALVTQAAAVQQQHQQQQQQQEGDVAAAGAVAAAAAAPAAAAPQDPRLVPTLAVLVLQQSSWFQPSHFAACAAALCRLGVSNAAVWDSLTAAAEHKVGAFTFEQLSLTFESLALAGFTPDLAWLERAHRQAGKHLHAAAASDVAVLMWAWGEMGYTPRDRLFMNQVKIITRRSFDQLSGLALVQLVHGLARMPRYAPNPGWLAALAKAVRPHLPDLPAGAVVDLLLSLVALGFDPQPAWLDAALEQLQGAMQDALAVSSTSASSSGGGGDLNSSAGPGVAEGFIEQQQEQQEQEQQQPLFFVPLDLQRQLGQLMPEAPGLLLAQGGTDSQQQLQVLGGGPAPEELQQLQELFEDAAAAAEAEASHTAGDSPGSDPQQQQQQQQPEQQQAAEATAAAAAAPPFTMQQPGTGPDVMLSESAAACRLAPYHAALSLQDVGVLCWCLGRVQHMPRPAWMQRLGRLLLRHSPGAPREVLVESLLGCVAAGYLPAGLLQQRLLGALGQEVERMPAECLRRLCQALSSYEAGLEQQQQQQQWGQGAIFNSSSRVDTAEAPAAAAAAAAAGASLEHYLQQQRPALAAAIMQRQGIILSSSSTAQLADVLAFLAGARARPSLDYMATAVKQAVGGLPAGVPAPALCRLLWGLGRLGFKPHPALLHQLLAALQRGLHLLSSQDLADAVWALSTLKHRPSSSWLALLLKEVAARAPYMAPQALTDTLWALACFAAQPDREWLKGVVAAVGARAASGALGPQNAAVVVWALTQLGFRPAEFEGSAVAGAVAGLLAAVAGQQ